MIIKLYITAGLEIATHWSPVRPKIECWRLDFHNWSPAGDSRFVRQPRINRSELRNSFGTGS